MLSYTVNILGFATLCYNAVMVLMAIFTSLEYVLEENDLITFWQVDQIYTENFAELEAAVSVL